MNIQGQSALVTGGASGLGLGLGLGAAVGGGQQVVRLGGADGPGLRGPRAVGAGAAALALLLALGLTTVVVLGVMRDTQRALGDTLGLAHALARGNLTIRIGNTSQDELGQMARALDEATQAELRHALARHEVIFFRDQDLTPEQHRLRLRVRDYFNELMTPELRQRLRGAEAGEDVAHVEQGDEGARVGRRIQRTTWCGRSAQCGQRGLRRLNGMGGTYGANEGLGMAALLQAAPGLALPLGLGVDCAALAALPNAVLQHHGDESPAECRRHARPYIRAARMAPGLDLLDFATQYSDALAILLDAHVEAYGGSGKVFDWSLVPKSVPRPVVLSGGLHAGNVIEGILRVRPWAVDVSSGVESAKGIKDAAAIRRFCEAVREADARAASFEP